MPKDEKDVVILCRGFEEAPQEDKDRIQELFENTIDIYLEKKGIKKKDTK